MHIIKSPYAEFVNETKKLVEKQNRKNINKTFFLIFVDNKNQKELNYKQFNNTKEQYIGCKYIKYKYINSGVKKQIETGVIS